MKYSLLAALLLAASALADTPAQISADYRRQVTQALTKVNETLEKATVPLIADLVKSGDTATANQLREQMKDKAAGDPVANPLAGVAALFKSYDAARVKALEPAQKAAMSRIDVMLASSEGKKLEVVTELGKVRDEIEAGKVVQATAALSKSDFRNHLKRNKIPLKWGYFQTTTSEKRLGTLYLKEDGTLSIDAASPGTGTWLPTADPMVLAFDIQNAAKIPEKTEMIIKDGEATLKRVSGMRYLKAD
jgi:hypothetical protein